MSCKEIESRKRLTCAQINLSRKYGRCLTPCVLVLEVNAVKKGWGSYKKRVRSRKKTRGSIIYLKSTAID